MLAELDDRGIGFITLRARHPGMTKALATLPPSAWKPMTLGQTTIRLARRTYSPILRGPACPTRSPPPGGTAGPSATGTTDLLGANSLSENRR